MSSPLALFPSYPRQTAPRETGKPGNEDADGQRPYTEDDEPGVSDSPAGPNGDHNCDTPVSLADSMYAAITDVAPDAAFAICTGDIVDHTVWNTSFEYNTFSSASPLSCPSLFPHSFHLAQTSSSLFSLSPPPLSPGRQ